MYVRLSSHNLCVGKIVKSRHIGMQEVNNLKWLEDSDCQTMDRNLAEWRMQMTATTPWKQTNKLDYPDMCMKFHHSTLPQWASE